MGEIKHFDFSQLGTEGKIFLSFSPIYPQISTVLHFENTHIRLHSMFRGIGHGDPMVLKIGNTGHLIREITDEQAKEILINWGFGLYQLNTRDDETKEGAFYESFPEPLNDWIINAETEFRDHQRNLQELLKPNE
jgi:hypothetical protein